MNSWRLFPFHIEPADYQLAAGEAMLAGLETTSKPAVRWYSTSTPALILGKGQPAFHVDSDACHEAGVSLLRRSSGGTAVLMTRDLLMLDVALPNNHLLYAADVTKSYRWFGEVWVAALHTFGLPARTLSTQEARDDAQNLDPFSRRVCFGGLSPYEVVVNHRKIVGLAQIRRRSGVLIQSGIYMHLEPYRLARLLKLEPHERQELEQTLLARATGLADEHTINTTTDIAQQVMSAFAVALAKIQGVTLYDDDWNAEELVWLRQVRHATAAKPI
jgi:lipoate---protein ligase